MRAVFFDRDGTLMEEVEYCSDPANVRVFPNAPAALARLKKAGFGVFVVSNQSGIGRGYFTKEQYAAVQEEFLRQVGEHAVDGTYYCPDAPGVPSRCRKPEPGMVLEAARQHTIELAGSFFVGDKAADIECGLRAGTRTILVLTGYGATQICEPDYRCADAAAAVDWILENAG